MFGATRVGGRRTAAGTQQKMWQRKRSHSKLPASFTVDHRKFSELLTAWLDEPKHAKHSDRSMLLKLRDDLDKFD